VIIAGRRETEGQSVVKQIETAGGSARFIQADVTRESEVKNIVDETIKTFGRLDVAFNNAGVEYTGPLTEFSVEDYRKIFDVNVLGVFLALKYEIPAMLKSGGGSIVNTSSVAGLIGMAGVGIYVASKHAVEGITKTAALEYAQQGIRVNAIAPAAIETAMIDRFAGPEGSEARRELAAMHPVGRTGSPREVANAVLFLASDLSTFTTGITLPVDGGWTAH
jgi:NAD(P)-dependent dehydrogenase (short-subunit alcohol dehydrogenase family)